jgi:rhodanese-related sulfurtransferase
MMAANTVSLSDVGKLLGSGRHLNMVDVRTRAEFSRVHARGARSVPLHELDPSVVASHRSDPNEPIYIICQSGGRSAKACQQFQDAGVSEVYSIEGGTAAWEKAGLPVERSGGKVIALERQVRIAAGFLVLAGTILAWTIHPAFLAVPAFVGAGLMVAGITDFCGMGMLLSKMPWNR